MDDSPEDLPGLLVGDTPVAENEGLDWPLRFLAPRLSRFHRERLPTDALGVGVDCLKGAEARELFACGFLPIRSWTVRTESCRRALIDLGVDSGRIALGADWAWLYRPFAERASWAESVWSVLGIDPRRPLLVSNVVNMVWKDDHVKDSIAGAFDVLHRDLSLQIAFFCNETRPGDFFDYEAARDIQRRMREPSVIVPHEYYSPDEALALLRAATVTVGQRYHFAVETILAGSVPVCIVRGRKMTGLVEELGLPVAGRIESVDTDVLIDCVKQVLANREAWRARLQCERQRMRERASHNLDLIGRMPPYRGLV